MLDEAEYMGIFAMIKAIDNFLMEGKGAYATALSGILNRMIDEIDKEHGGLCSDK